MSRPRSCARSGGRIPLPVARDRPRPSPTPATSVPPPVGPTRPSPRVPARTGRTVGPTLLTPRRPRRKPLHVRARSARVRTDPVIRRHAGPSDVAGARAGTDDVQCRAAPQRRARQSRARRAAEPRRAAEKGPAKQPPTRAPPACRCTRGPGARSTRGTAIIRGSGGRQTGRPRAPAGLHRADGCGAASTKTEERGRRRAQRPPKPRRGERVVDYVPPDRWVQERLLGVTRRRWPPGCLPDSGSARVADPFGLVVFLFADEFGANHDRRRQHAT